MQIKPIVPLPITALLTCLLTACSAHFNWDYPGHSIQPLNKETTELADVTADVLELANQLGSEHVLMVFDIDNTLLAMEQGLGADQWYEWQADLTHENPCSVQNVGNRFAAQGALFFISAMRPTQVDAASQVKAIQNSGVAVIVVTSRGPQYRLQTFRELRRNGHSFSHSAIGPVGGYDEAFIPVEGGRLSRYEDGVFMTAGQNKGEMLYALLQKTGTPLPKVIVIVDDKQKNLDAVIETFNALQVPVHAWRYGREDNTVKNFDRKRANAEWRSIEPALRQIQQVMGPDNYDLGSVVLPKECE